MSRAEIEIRSSSHPDAETTLLAHYTIGVGCSFAVRKCDGCSPGWRITHIPSGFSVGPKRKTKREAMKLARLLQSECPAAAHVSVRNEALYYYQAFLAEFRACMTRYHAGVEAVE